MASISLIVLTLVSCAKGGKAPAIAKLLICKSWADVALEFLLFSCSAMASDSADNSGEDGLKSWHPAHMPHENNTADLQNLETNRQFSQLQSNDIEGVQHGLPNENSDANAEDRQGSFEVEQEQKQSSRLGERLSHLDDGTLSKRTRQSNEHPRKTHTETSGSELENESFTASIDDPSQERLNAEKGQTLSQDFPSYSRTNSFPDVPVPRIHQREASRQSALSNSQVVDLMRDDVIEPTFSHHSDDPLMLPSQDDSNDFFGSVVANQAEDTVFLPANEEARYEEGVPLMLPDSGQDYSLQDLAEDPTTGASKTNQVAPSSEDWFGQDFDDAETSSFFKPQPLDRKSTSQVLGSLQFPPRSIAHDEIREEGEGNSPENISRRSTGFSTSEATSQAASELKSADSERLETPNAQDDSKGQDIAAMWQAALDDDEFLDEDDSDHERLGSEGVEEVFNRQQNHFSDTVQVHQNSSALQPGFGQDGDIKGFGEGILGPGNGSASLPSRYMPSSFTRQDSTNFVPQPPSIGSHQPAPVNNSMSHSSSAPPSLRQMSFQPPYNANGVASTRPSIPKSTQSFSDKSKGGYTSPYDLPMDVSRPKKRTSLQKVQNVSNNQALSQPPPPPRSSSMFVGSSPISAVPPPLPRNLASSTSIPPARPPSSDSKSKSEGGSFFEELPTVKARPLSRTGKQIPQTLQHDYGSRDTASLPEPPQQPPAAQRSTSLDSPNTSHGYQLLPPERLSPYTALSAQEPVQQGAPPIKSRYSPAPTSQSHVPPLRNRYTASPLGGSRPSQSSHGIPFQPRTSSPLAYSTSNTQQQRTTSVPSDMTDRSRQNLPLNETPQRSISSATTVSTSASQSIKTPESISDHYYQEHSFQSGPTVPVPETHSEKSPASTSNYQKTTSPKSSLSTDGFDTMVEMVPASQQGILQYSPQARPPSEPEEKRIEPPLRSQTQSPGALRSKPEPLVHANDLYQRPASVNAGASPTHVNLPPSGFNSTSARRRGTSIQELAFIQPTDGREHDPLERWKGCPVFSFGFGGTIVTSFPKRVPRYATGHNSPMIKCSPGEVRVQTRKTMPLDEEIANFPGPLKSKSKKKETIDWLQKRIAHLEALIPSIQTNPIPPDPMQRHREKVLLWKVVKILVEYDGIVAGNESAMAATRAVLAPEVSYGRSDEGVVDNLSVVSGITRATGSRPSQTSTDPDTLEAMRQLLLKGEREKAVWHAVDQKMWAHAMVLASTLDKAVWKQVLHEFVRQEVKTVGANTEPLSVLFEVFAGNWEESVDELVPPSARAGLQMISKAAPTGPNKTAFDGLDRWRETLTLILSNRTKDDASALVALGRLLLGYGRIEAAHVCFVFAAIPGLFGGSDDPQVTMTLLGADHLHQPYDYSRDLDSILLTEIYDFAWGTLSSTAALTVSPYLQSYRLHHAMVLADHGYRSEAQQYCDAISNALKSTTKPSPYYHSLLFNCLEDFAGRLRQAPRDGASWMSRPMDKVSGGVWQRFNNFIAGDDSDTPSATSTKNELDVGPFAGVTGSTPSISREVSSPDLFNTYAYGGGAPMPVPSVPTSESRYIPGSQHVAHGQYTPRSSLEQPSHASQDLQRSLPRNAFRSPQFQPSYPLDPHTDISSPKSYHEQQHQSYKSPYQPLSDDLQPESYLPTPPSQPDHPFIETTEDPLPSLSLINSSQNTPSNQPNFQDHLPSADIRSSSVYEPPSSDINSEFPTYEPPSTSTFGQADYPDSSFPVQNSPEHSSPYMYGDEASPSTDQAAISLKQEKAERDRAADEAFRKAAEADARKGPELKPKKSWFGGVGGWLGSKKESNISSQEPKAIKAKLGEESSFYYDKELGRWMNKKGDAPTSVASATPPPPKGPPSRAVSAAGGPPPRPTNTSTPPVPPLPTTIPKPTIQSSTPPINFSDSSPAAAQQLSAPASGAGTPARGTSPNNTVPPAATAGTPPITGSGGNGLLSSAPPSRPATGMSNDSSLDDLVGAPQARKGGTVKRAKKGRGYVDVMAK
ncbi:MAG: hypothetical protein Q9190_004396 [Brigantiaea leucoxantha]